MSRGTQILLAGWCLALAAAGSAAVAAPPAQDSFTMLPHQAGSGMALLRQAHDANERSARRITQQALQTLATGLDRAPRVLSGMVSREDDAAMLSFAGHHRGTLVQGWLLTQVARQGGSTVAVAMDEPQRLAQTGPLLLAAADAAAGGGGAGGAPGAGSAGASPYRNLPWTQVSFGTGQLSLPQGWQVVGQYQGAVDIAGPQGEAMSLGVASQVMTPQAAQQLMAMGMQPQIYVAPATPDPVQAFRNVQPQIEGFSAARGAPVVQLTRVRESERVPLGTFNAALVASDGVASVGNRPYRKLSLVAAGGVMANGNWLYYSSEVYAPAELYAHALPVMLKIWNSWSVDKSVLMERMVSAARSMRETNDILQSVHANRQQSQDRLSAAFGHHIRGTVVVADTQSGQRSTEWLYQSGPAAAGLGTEHNRHMADVVRGANQAAGYARWQILNP
ncbi:MAG: hypothetical protein KA141_09380 [Rubrivivax sp.]|nr:hypothetical protein [Rubrivivax sp.]